MTVQSPIDNWWRGLTEVPGDLGRTAVVIGNFDGVHRGHQAVIERAKQLAGDLPLVAVTFFPHPMAVVRPDIAPRILTDAVKRAELLKAAGADAVLTIPFDLEVASWSPDEFAREVLVDRLHAALVVVGDNFRYGHRAAGDVACLAAFGSEYDFRVEGLALAGDAAAWCSTDVRRLVADGDVAAATAILGHPPTVRGVVVRGDQRGRELGFPTANVPADDKLAVPADGVYAGWLTRLDSGERFPAAISVGTNPTFEGVLGRRVESYVLDATLDLYGIEVEVEFVHRIRGMVAFTTVEALIDVIEDDVKRTRRLLDL